MDDIQEEEDIYRLKYRDAEGTPSDRRITIKSLLINDNPSNSYIYAYCFSAMDFRQFRFDRIRALYKGKEKIKEPFSYLPERHKGLINVEVDTASLAKEALSGEKIPSEAPSATEAKDFPTLKNGPRNCYIISAILIFLGIVTISTVIFPILFFGVAVVFLFAARKAKKEIQKKEQG